MFGLKQLFLVNLIYNTGDIHSKPSFVLHSVEFGNFRSGLSDNDNQQLYRWSLIELSMVYSFEACLEIWLTEVWVPSMLVMSVPLTEVEVWVPSRLAMSVPNTYWNSGTFFLAWMITPINSSYSLVKLSIIYSFENCLEIRLMKFESLECQLC